MSTAHYQSEPGNERRRERRVSSSWPIEFFQFGTKDTPGQDAVAIDLSRERNSGIFQGSNTLLAIIHKH